jgi:hypothetical protein
MQKFITIIFCFFLCSTNHLSAQCAPKMVLLEQSCFKDCGPCILHQVEDIDPLYKENINKIAMVVYSQAPIGIGKFSNNNLPYSGFYNTFGIEYQSVITADRTFFADNYNETQGPTSEGVEDAKKAFKKQSSSTYVPVKVDISNTYDPATRKVDVTLTANFCDTASGDLRFYLVLTQDTIVGPSGIDYAQNVNSSVGSTWNGYKVVAYPPQVGAWLPSYPFKDAVKYQPSGFFGNAGIIPKKPTLGTTYKESYSFILPKKNATTEQVEIDPKRIQIIAAVVKKGVFKNREVLNANKKYLTKPSSVGSTELPDDKVDFTVNNPVSDVLVLKYSTINKGIGSINIYNAAGEILNVVKEVEFDTTVSTKTIDVSDFSNGIYFVSLNVGGVFHTRKFIVAK